jgi:serine O-acetyltransferase
VLLTILYRFCNFILVTLISGGEIPARCQIGAGLRLPHHANGVIIHPDASIGDDVTIFHQVTIGINEQSSRGPGAPTIGNRVVIGAGAKVLGPVQIGDGSSVGANAVVVNDVPANATAVGVPAKVLMTHSAES